MCRLRLSKSYLQCIAVATDYQGMLGKHLQSSLLSAQSAWETSREAQPSESRLIPLSRLTQVCPFSLRVVSVVGITYLLPQEEQPLCHPTVER